MKLRKLPTLLSCRSCSCRENITLKGRAPITAHKNPTIITNKEIACKYKKNGTENTQTSAVAITTEMKPRPMQAHNTIICLEESPGTLRTHQLDLQLTSPQPHQLFPHGPRNHSGNAVYIEISISTIMLAQTK